MRKLLREPLVHFAILGVLLFAYFNLRATSADVPDAPDQIVVSEADVQQLMTQYETVWRRPPAIDEVNALIAAHIEEEILVREALALGLDRGDAAIRNRLRQKMRFLTESAAQALTPDDAILEQHLQENADAFSYPARLSIQQVYLGETASDTLIRDVREQLDAGAQPGMIGKRTLLPPDLDNATPAQIDASFGSGFFEKLDKAEPEQWVGPLRSGYGYHLVRVSEMVPARQATLDEVREKVLADWRRVQADTLAEAQIRVLEQRYEIVTPDPETVQGLLAQ